MLGRSACVLAALLATAGPGLHAQRPVHTYSAVIDARCGVANHTGSRNIPSAVNGELVFWRAVTLADRGRVDEAIPLWSG